MITRNLSVKGAIPGFTITAQSGRVTLGEPSRKPQMYVIPGDPKVKE